MGVDEAGLSIWPQERDPRTWLIVAAVFVTAVAIVGYQARDGVVDWEEPGPCETRLRVTEIETCSGQPVTVQGVLTANQSDVGEFTLVGELWERLERRGVTGGSSIPVVSGEQCQSDGGETIAAPSEPKWARVSGVVVDVAERPGVLVCSNDAVRVLIAK